MLHLKQEIRCILLLTVFREIQNLVSSRFSVCYAMKILYFPKNDASYLWFYIYTIYITVQDVQYGNLSRILHAKRSQTIEISKIKGNDSEGKAFCAFFCTNRPLSLCISKYIVESIQYS